MTNRSFAPILATIVLSNALVTGGMLAGAFWYLKNEPQDIGELINAVRFEQPEPIANGPSFHSLDKLVLGVKGLRQTHYVMLELAIETRRPESIKAIDDYMPVTRNALLKMFSEKTYEQLQQQSEIEDLQNELKQTLLKAFANTPFVEHIDDVILTKYVIQ